LAFPCGVVRPNKTAQESALSQRSPSIIAARTVIVGSGEVNDIGLSVTFAEHPQGGCKKGKPLEAAVEAAEQSGQPAPEGMWMPGSLRLLEDALLEGRLRLCRNPVLVSAIMSAVIESER